MWMDFIHCINADGWSLMTKKDVVEWCLHRMDDLMKDEKFTHKNRLDLSTFYKEVNDYIRRDEWHYHEGLDVDDAIILYYRSLISNAEQDCFEEGGVKPHPSVLPLHYSPAYYNDGKYTPDHKPSFTFADMHCDVLERINKFFLDHVEQEPNRWGDFEYIEGWMTEKSWKDVWVLNGTDSLLDCFEDTLSGEFLKHTHNNHYKDEDFLNLNIYEHCTDFEDDKRYVCRIKKVVDEYGWVEYKLMSILKEV